MRTTLTSCSSSITVEPLTSTYVNDMYRIDAHPPTSMVAYPHHQQRASSVSFNLAAGHSSTPSISSSVGSNLAQLAGAEASPVISDCSDGEKQVRNLMRASPSRRIVTLATPVPAQASMMGQFNSKVSSSAQKRHVCKVCDKRFTRPSSLQTHMYSHTGEKRKFLAWSTSGEENWSQHSMVNSIRVRTFWMRSSLLGSFQPSPAQENARKQGATSQVCQSSRRWVRSWFNTVRLLR